MRTCIILLLIAAFLVGCTAPLRLNEIQVIGSHNSYKMEIDPELLNQIAAADQKLAASLDYSQLEIPAQLDLGLRKFELDVYYDPEGGRYLKPSGLLQIKNPKPYSTDELAYPGFKVMHIQDIDFRSRCPRLENCIKQIVTWSQNHPRHLPIYITINAKDDVIDLPGFVKPLAFDDAAWNDLDQTLMQGFGNKLYTPDEFRGELDSLSDAVAKGWPSLASMRGRVIVVLDHGGEKLKGYIADHPALRGRAMFVNALEGTAEAAIRIVNDPIADFDRIQDLVRQGYIVRTRSDADTLEARTGDSTRRDRAFASGAQIISTDYYQPDLRFSDFQVEFPNGALVRCNPVLRLENRQKEEGGTVGAGNCSVKP